MTAAAPVTPIEQAATDDSHFVVLQQQFARIEKALQRYLNAAHQRVQRQSSHESDADVSAAQLDMLARWHLTMPAWHSDECRRSHAEADRAVIAAGSRLALLIERFELNQFERDALLFSLMPLATGSASLLFAALQGNASERWPTPELVLNLLSRDDADRVDNETCLSGRSALIRDALVTVPETSRGGEPPAFLQGNAHVYRYLCGRDTPLAQSCCRWLDAPDIPDLLPELTDQLSGYLRKPVPHALLVSLQGGTDQGRQMALARAVGVAGARLLLFDMEQAPHDATAFRGCFVEALRESRLHAACLVLRELHAYWEKHPESANWLNARLLEHPLPLFCMSGKDVPLLPLPDVPQVVVPMPESAVKDEVHLLESLLRRYSVEPGVDAGMLVRRFRPAPDTVLQSLNEADVYRRHRGADALADIDLKRAFRQRSQRAFGNLATRVEPRRNFGDLVVADDLRKQLEEVLAAVRFREDLLARGFARKIAYGTGISTLFHGDSGTGKTLIAEVLAGALGVDMIKVDLATVVNKYIGETEKNLARIFDLAETDCGLLFFDEADALFGKRSETRDSHDRYANIEISYLLQRLENYPGLVVLATNNRSHLDDAFTRRLTFIIRIPFPDAVLREQMWRSIWPAQVKVAEDVDFSALARRAELTGANIRNIALLAGWLAASDDAPCIHRKHIDRALQRELSKMGRVI